MGLLSSLTRRPPCTITRTTVLAPDQDRIWRLLTDYGSHPDWRGFVTAEQIRGDGQEVWRLAGPVRTQGFFRVQRREAFSVAAGTAPGQLVHHMRLPARGERRLSLEGAPGGGTALTLVWTGPARHRHHLTIEADRLIAALIAVANGPG